jgi:hypothetical protein
LKVIHAHAKSGSVAKNDDGNIKALYHLALKNKLKASGNN